MNIAPDRRGGDADRWREPARSRELARLAAELGSDPAHDADAYLAAVRAVLAPGWVPRRPAPKLPSLWEIASYWAARDVFAVDLEHPHCFACSAAGPQSSGRGPQARWNHSRGFLDRGHLVNRARHGLDGPQNLVPLCLACNHLMPVFDPGRAADAIGWVRAGGPWPALESRMDRREPALRRLS